MIGIVVLVLATLASIELVWATGVLHCLARVSREGQRATRLLMRRHVSEWAKERAMRLMSGRLMVHSLRGLGLIAVVASPFVVAMAVDAWWPYGFAHAYTNWTVRLALLAISLIYLFTRRRFRKAAVRSGGAEGDKGGAFERTLQRVALGNRAMLEITFDIERARYKPWKDEKLQPGPLFVTGLARAGTTILTRLLHEQYGMASLTYRDLPFPLAPNSWAKLSAGFKRQVERSERGHGDGIFHDLDSAEAIEEVFWRHFEGARYVGPQGLSPVPPTDETVGAFRDYVGLIRRRYGGARYLSKNNANVLRLPALIEAFPQAVLAHPFRAPLQQAESLRRQHALALKLAEDDPFRRDFMRWLGHYEFGGDQRPFLFPGHPPPGGDRSGIDYWLQLWVSVYAALLNQPETVHARQIFVDFDAICANAPAFAAPLTELLALPALWDLSSLHAAPSRPVNGASPHVLEAAEAIHAALRARTLCVHSLLSVG
ncbi:sulfotransferase [Acetobacter conturbans]|uniref:Sulfotransferase n=1 Tax=Acetobacter conturbans TaxID=1737472 RepID=A0ABX0K098_9PROT|nr:sulfotransferase [Acetobacter conturbans]NHN89048.1 sulfotransferase [Acetobacter conturbans]